MQLHGWTTSRETSFNSQTHHSPLCWLRHITVSSHYQPRRLTITLYQGPLVYMLIWMAWPLNTRPSQHASGSYHLVANCLDLPYSHELGLCRWKQSKTVATQGFQVLLKSQWQVAANDLTTDCNAFLGSLSKYLCRSHLCCPQLFQEDLLSLQVRLASAKRFYEQVIKLNVWQCLTILLRVWECSFLLPSWESPLPSRVLLPFPFTQIKSVSKRSLHVFDLF